MSLTFVLGSSGAGKSQYLYKEIVKQAAEQPDCLFLVIVPEQFTLQTQRDLVMATKGKGIANIDVLSFVRLAHRVFEEFGGLQKILLEDTGKSLIVKRVLRERLEKLSVFAGNIRMAGFVDEMKSMLSELYQYGIKKNDLLEMKQLAGNYPGLLAKLSDLYEVYDGFEQFLQEKYLAMEELSDHLAEVIDKSKMMKNCVVCFDGFTGFTPSQYGLLTKLFRCAKRAYVTLTMDAEVADKRLKEHELFYLPVHTKELLAEMAIRAGVELTPPVLLCKGNVPYRFKQGSGLAHLEKELYRYPFKRYAKDVTDISVYAVKNKREEAVLLAAKALELVQSGMRYRDMAVITGDMDGYGELLQKEFLRAGIPVFLDRKKSIYQNMCVEYIRAVLEFVYKDFTFESVFRYLKCALSGWDMEEVAELENYCLACGIRGKYGWQREWAYAYRTKSRIPIADINKLRERLLEDMLPIKEKFLEAKTAGERTKVLYECLVAHQVEQQLLVYADRFEQEGNLLRAKEYRQVYGEVIHLFDQLMELLADEELEPKEYVELMETGLKEGKVGLIPQGMDQVVIGDITRTRLKDIKVLFLAGVNDGILPAVQNDGGILSTAERELLKEKEVALAPTKKESSYTDQFYLYLAVTRPQETLILSYSLLDAEGKPLRPSPFLYKLFSLFPKLTVKGMEHTLLRNDKGQESLLAGLGSYASGETATPEFLELYRHLKLTNETEADRLLAAAFPTKKSGSIGKQAAHRLYGLQLYGSVTRMEQYAACAFAHFLNYGIGLEERVEHKVSMPDIGNLFHAALEVFSYKMKEKELTWHDLTEDTRNELAKESLDVAIAEAPEGLFSSSKRNEYIVVRVKRILDRTLKVLQAQINESLFEPAGYEAAFYHTDRYLNLSGKIDRYDLCEVNGKWYLRVIDYKSGKQDFDLEELYYGLQLQLGVYLSAALEQVKRENNQKEVLPAGIFYYHMDDPMVEKGEDVDEEIAKKLRLRGLVNETPSVIQAMDQNFCCENGGLRESVKSVHIPVETDKTGAIAKRSKVAGEEKFTAMLSYIYDRLHGYSEEIMEGNTEAAPYRLKGKTGCDYCRFQEICGSKVGQYRDLPAKSEEEIWEEFCSAYLSEM